MTDLHQLAQKHKDLSEDAQKKAGTSSAKPMPKEHTDFVATITRLVDSGEIDVHTTDTFLNQKAYDALSQSQKDEIALALVNLADEVRHIYEFYTSKQTPNESPELQQMVEHAWAKTQKIESAYGDVFKF